MCHFSPGMVLRGFFPSLRALCNLLRASNCSPGRGGGSRQTPGLTQEWKEAARVRDAAPWSRQDLQSCLDIRMSMQVQGVPKDAGCSPAPAILGGFNPGGRRLGKEAIPPDEGKACSKQDGVCFMLA